MIQDTVKTKGFELNLSLVRLRRPPVAMMAHPRPVNAGETWVGYIKGLIIMVCSRRSSFVS